MAKEHKENKEEKQTAKQPEEVNEDFDIEEVVSEQDEKDENKEPVLEDVDEKDSASSDKGDDEPDVLEKAVAESKQEAEAIVEEEDEKPKKERVKGDRNWAKTFLTVILTALVTAALVLGVVYFLNQKKSNEDQASGQNSENQVQEEVKEEPTAVEEESQEKFVYISSEVGLNLREKPTTSSKVLAIIPFATKIIVLDEDSGWIKTEYQNQTGWVSADYTQETNPLVYENKTYGFKMTFKPSWAGYKFVESQNLGTGVVASYYVALPTSDSNWSESNIPSGYASLIAMAVYTKSQWATIESTDGPKPAKITESDQYVYTYLPAQARPEDLATQYDEISEIIKTFELI